MDKALERKDKNKNNLQNFGQNLSGAILTLPNVI